MDNPELEREVLADNWQALKDDLAARIDSDAAVMRDFRAVGDEKTAAAHGALVSANRSTLAKMRELEAAEGTCPGGC